MLVKAALAAALVLATGLPAAGQQLPPGADLSCLQQLPPGQPADTVCHTSALAPQAARPAVILAPTPGEPADIVAGRGPEPHARELREIVLATITGQHERARMVARQAEKFGLTEDRVQDVLDGTRFHYSASVRAVPRLRIPQELLPEVEPGWEHSQ